MLPNLSGLSHRAASIESPQDATRGLDLVKENREYLTKDQAGELYLLAERRYLTHLEEEQRQADEAKRRAEEERLARAAKVFPYPPGSMVNLVFEMDAELQVHIQGWYGQPNRYITEEFTEGTILTDLRVVNVDLERGRVVLTGDIRDLTDVDIIMELALYTDGQVSVMRPLTRNSAKSDLGM
jgi:hypothetical protein